MLKGAVTAPARHKKSRTSGALKNPAQESNACLRPASSDLPLQNCLFRATGTIMIRFLLRFIGLCLLALAFIFFVYDGTKTIANQQLITMKVSDAWAIVDQNSLNLVQNWLKQKLAFAWDPYLQKIFDLPTWVVLGIVATILILLGRKKKPLIGYGRD
jgi:hypothetical protein